MIVLPELEKSDQMIKQAALSLGNFSEAKLKPFARGATHEICSNSDNAAAGVRI